MVESIYDLKGKTVKILEASEGELLIEVGGRKYYIVPDYECIYEDCSGPDDPSEPYLKLEEVEE